MRNSSLFEIFGHGKVAKAMDAMSAALGMVVLKPRGLADAFSFHVCPCLPHVGSMVLSEIVFHCSKAGVNIDSLVVKFQLL